MATTFRVVPLLNENYNWYSKLGQALATRRFSEDLLYSGPGLADGWRQVAHANQMAPSFYADLDRYVWSPLATWLEGRGKEINLIDLGVGTYEKANWFIHKLLDRGKLSNVNFYPVDISYEMLARGQVLIGAVEHNLHKLAATGSEILGLHADFADLAKVRECTRQDLPTITLFLGNTLGNMDHDAELLLRIQAALSANDLLVVEVQAAPSGTPDQDTLALYYRGAEQFFFGPLLRSDVHGNV